MTDLTKCKGNGQPKLKVEADDSCRGKLQNVKSQISGFPQQKLVTKLIKPIDISLKHLHDAKDSLKHDTEQLFVHGVFVLSVASMETMLSDVLRYHLVKFPQTLSMDFKFEKEEFFESHFNLLERGIDKYIYGLSYESFDSYFKKFLKCLSIEWNNFQDSYGKDFQKIKKNRNLLLHDGNVVHEKTKQSKINCDYVIESIDKIINFEGKLKRYIYDKYKEYTKINANKRLWEFMFKTLLMPYDDYWHYDELKDHIYGLKKSRYENDLSGSETMLLELWRSQFNGSPIKYFNMKHLVGEVREKAMFFLSIAESLVSSNYYDHKNKYY